MNNYTAVYFDLNRTIILTDKATGKDLEGILQSAIAWNTKAEWSDTSGEVNYHEYIAGIEADKSRRHEYLRRFVEVELPSWRSPKSGEPHPQLHSIQEQFARVKKLMEGRYFVPAFTHFVTRCIEEKKEVRLIFRTFGHDIPEVKDNYERLFPGRKISHLAAFKGHELHSKEGVFATAEKVHQYFMNLQGDAAIQDDWSYWNNHGEGKAFGKLFPIGGGRSFFFDDNITGRADQDIVCPVDPASGKLLSHPAEAICVDTIAAIEDPNYFYNYVFPET